MGNRVPMVFWQSAMLHPFASSRVLFATLAFLLATGVAGSSFAASEGRVEVDDDHDSLIDVYDLEDFEAIRANPDGSEMYGLTEGCPNDVCTGYELRVDLDFDDLVDPFWDPIDELTCTLDGGGHVIRNLALQDYESGPALQPLGIATVPAGLFSFLNGAVVRNLRFEDVTFDDVGDYTGVLAGFAHNSSLIEGVIIAGGHIDAGTLNGVGGLVGVCQDSEIVESVVGLEIIAGNNVGGLVGYSQNCWLARNFVHGRTVSSRYDNSIGGLAGTVEFGRIENSYVTGSTGEGHIFGGLIGRAVGLPEIENSFVTAAVIGISSGGGGLIGLGDATFISSYHATDATGFENTSTGVDAGTGVLLADLRCPTAASDPNCKGGTMFAGWGSVLNLNGQPAWAFGSSEQLPALRINNVVYRDSDGDGVLDADDDFPYRWEASLDSDGDGAIDRWKEGCDEDCRSGSDLVLDQFPDDPDATLDLDLDGDPEAWNPGCGATCQATSNLTVDSHPNDFDNDGCPDATGPGNSSCPATGDLDDNGDGSDDIDDDSDGLIDIYTLEDLLTVDYDPTGASKRESGEVPEGGIPLEDTSGCSPRIVRGILARECNGYELRVDLNMDTDNSGILDSGDTYWNDGDGWNPLGDATIFPPSWFQTNFEGNGHTIANVLTTGHYTAGLFGGARGANIRNLGIIGTEGQGFAQAVGGLVGVADNSTITNCYARAGAIATDHAGGLVGLAQGTHIVGSFAGAQAAGYGSDACRAGGLVGSLVLGSSVTASFASGYVSNICGGSGVIAAGGLVGFMDETSSVSGSYSIGPVDGAEDSSGGLVGLAEGTVTDSYWATDTSTRMNSAGGGLGALVDELECPTDADDSSCVLGASLYAGWDAYAQPGAPSYWDFGNSSELPGLCMGGQLHRVDAVGFLQAPTECACTASEVELVTNQGFESGTSGWTGFSASLSSSTAQAHTGTRSLRIANRGNVWSGADYTLLNIAERGETLSTSLWARTEGVASAPVKLTVRYACQGGTTQYIPVDDTTATNGAWARLSGDVQIPDCQLTELTAYAEGPPPGVAFYIDDVTFASTELSCSGGPTEGIYGDYTVYTDWGSGYCLEVVIHNATGQPTTNWSAQIDLNGTVIDSGNHWNVSLSGYTGTVTLSSAQPWGQVIQPGGNTYSLGFCATRPPGNSSLPEEPVVTANF